MPSGTIDDDSGDLWKKSGCNIIANAMNIDMA